MQLEGNLPHGETLIVIELQHLPLPLRQHLLPGQPQIPVQALQLLLVVRGALPGPVCQIRQPLAALGIQTDLFHASPSLS